MFTRFANPHALDSKIEVVSRKALILDDTGSTAGAAHDDALLTELNLLLKRSLGDVDIPESVDEKARKKRRKIEREHRSSIKPQDVDGPNSPVSMRKPCPSRGLLVQSRLRYTVLQHSVSYHEPFLQRRLT